ncbi:MAG: hypothetical protein ISS16_11025, partial [Ignavibacteria bacterium]|nr:hypothetical protein [Ignavibacteria bacterium]
MKKVFLIFLLFLFILVISYCHAQYNNWRVVSLQRNLNSIIFVSENKGWIYGGDYSYKTDDGGVTWSNPIKQYPIIGWEYSTVYRSPRLVYFIDSLYGWAAQYTEILLKTTNGGENWIYHNTGFNSSHDLYGVHFINRLTGWAIGDDHFYNKGLIIKTTNGGINWIKQSSNSNWGFNSLYMLDENKGFVACWSTDTIGYTTNGGNNWFRKKIGNGYGIARIWFKDTLNGWALGDPDYVSRTTNGGNNWNIYYINFGNTENFYFLNNLTGWMGTSFGNIYKSTNGGINWFIQLNTPTGSNYDGRMFDVFFKDENTGWALKGNGIVFKSFNGGTNWVEQISPPLGLISSIYFSDLYTGWVTCNTYDTGYIYKSTNSGNNWHRQFTSSYQVGELTFVNDTTGYVSAYSRIYKTNNGGLNWFVNNVGGLLNNSIYFIDEFTGWACGWEGYIIKTTNSGVNWMSKVSNVTLSLNDIYFNNAQEGYIASDNGHILKTTDGGENWSVSIPYINNQNYSAIQFVNSNTGFIVGKRIYNIIGPVTNRVLLKTTNAGLSWIPKIDESLGGFHYYINLFFINNNTGWLVTSNDIRKTTNSGDNWSYVQSPIDESFNCIHFVNDSYGWIGGSKGTIITTSPPIGIQVTSNEIPQQHNLKQNYPNPFNPVTKIGYDLVKNSYILLKIYDLLGREIISLVNEKQ